MSEDGNFITPVHHYQNKTKYRKRLALLKMVLLAFCKQIPSKIDIDQAVLSN